MTSIDSAYEYETLSSNKVPKASNPDNYKYKNAHASMSDKLYDAIQQCFPGLIMTKTSSSGNYGIYKARIDCLLCSSGTRFCVAIVPNDDLQIGSRIKLSALRWISFQTRWQEETDEFNKFNMKSQHFEKAEGTILDDKIRLAKQDKTKYYYDPDSLPIRIELLATDPKNNNEYSPTGTVLSALDLFSTVLYIV